MKADWEEDYEMKEEYDFSKGVRGAYTQSFRDLNLVSLVADVKAVFPDSEAVNSALRSLIQAARAVVPEEMRKAS